MKAVIFTAIVAWAFLAYGTFKLGEAYGLKIGQDRCSIAAHERFE